MEAAEDKLRVKMENWAGHPMKNHVRVLLCTLPDILWEGHGLERVGMDKLLEVSAVRTSYRKYIARFHPDKITQTKDAEKIYIANFVFAAINEQWSEFKKEHGIK